jgi:hypothetical protein
MANADNSMNLVITLGSALGIGGLPADELGTYIFAANSYRAGYPPKGTWKKAHLPSVVRLVTNGGSADPKFALHPADGEMHEKPGTWKFKYAEHYVQRAVRIPYLYYRKSETDETIGMLVKDYFLVGFEGGGAY